jgi:adenylate cyclase
MAPKTTNLAILFADVSGSTRLFETLGDATARVKVSECLDTLTDVANNHSGTVIKTIGDEIMCTFPTADDAANAATEMHEELLEDVTEGVGDITQLAIRVGFHFGPAIMEGGDVFGDAVNVAARMAAQAKGGQIITTQSSVDLLAPMLRVSTRFVDRAPIKGKKEEIDIYEIIWQEEDVTRMATGMADAADLKPEVKLRVLYKDKDIILNKERSSLVMGRSNACDLPINEKMASRQHVRIELRRDKFFIIDQSTNGTHVLIENSDEEFLRREEMPLQGKGQISLGKSFSESPTEIVKFAHEI